MSTTTLRERLAGKKRRRTSLPIQLEGPSPAEGDLVVAWAEATAAESRNEEPARPSDDIAADISRMRDERYVDVTFTALESREWERVVATHPSPEGRDAGMDWRKALPVVAALCCDDESMQDDEPWAELTAQMTHGEMLSFWTALLNLNTDAPQAHVPKD